jgi:predicted RNase H-like nuclease (RuvC/YqgF family)
MSLLKIAAIGCVIAAVVALCFFLGYKGYSPFDQFYNLVTSYTTNFNVADMIKNPATILAAVGGITAVAIPLYNKLSAAKQQATQLADSAKTQLSSLQSEKENLEKKVSALEDQTKSLSSLQTQADKAAALQTKVNELQTSFDSISQQKTSYKNQYEEAKILLTRCQAQLEVLTPKVK